MYDYRRMMEQVTLSDRKKEEIMDMLENKGTQKRRKPSVKALVLVAALAVGCVLSIAAGLPGQVYNFFSGGSVQMMPTGADGSIGGAEAVFRSAEDSTPIILENGKLWFFNGGERTDLTGLIDENTPYTYEHTDPATGNKGYVIVGGTIDDFGWVEFFRSEDGFGTWVGENYYDNYGLFDGEWVLMDKLTSAQEEQLAELGHIDSEIILRPWFQAAAEQLGIF